MTTAQVVETSVTVNNNSPIQDYFHPDDQSQPLLFFHCSKSNEEADFRKAIQSYENTVGVNCRHTTHRTVKRGTCKGQTSQVIDMQLHEAVNYYTWYRIGCRKRTLIFRSFISGFAALDFTDFGRIPMFTMGRKVEIVSFVIRFYGIF